jgi:DNA-binding LytR/AlgR family response regulator
MIPKCQIGPTHVAAATTLTIIVDGKKSEIESDHILYIESLENYVRVFTIKEQLVTRMTTKEAALQLPEHFIRINRSCLINTRFITNWKGDEIIINETQLKISRTYNQYVIEHLKSQTI